MGMLFLKIYLTGLVILLVAIPLNLAASGLGLATWYSFLGQAGQKGLFPALQTLRVIDSLFLFLIYPALLGISAYLTLLLTNRLVT